MNKTFEILHKIYEVLPTLYLSFTYSLFMISDILYMFYVSISFMFTPFFVL